MLGCRGWGRVDVMIDAADPQALPAGDQHLARHDRPFAGADVGARGRHQLRRPVPAAAGRRGAGPRQGAGAMHEATRCRCPLDVKLMNVTATVLFVGLRRVLLAAALGWWALRHPLFAIGGITVRGRRDAQQRGDPARQRGAAAGRQFLHRGPAAGARGLRGGALGAPGDGAARVPEPAAGAAAGAPGGWRSGARTATSRLVNSFGEVFEANPGDVEDDDCRGWPGPEGTAARCWRCTGRCAPLFEPLELARRAAGADRPRRLERCSWTTARSWSWAAAATEEVVARSRALRAAR